MRSTPRALVSAVALLGLVAGSCGSDDESDAAPAAPATESVSGDLTVFAAASLTAAFTEIGDAFMVEFPDTTVTFNFAASSELVTQIDEGAPADVYASADLSNMTKLTDAGGNATEPVVFATNLAEIVVAPGTRRASPASPIWPTTT